MKNEECGAGCDHGEIDNYPNLMSEEKMAVCEKEVMEVDIKLAECAEHIYNVQNKITKLMNEMKDYKKTHRKLLYKKMRIEDEIDELEEMKKNV